MSSFNLAKKLQPARKAWKSFKNHLQSRLRHPKFVKTIITSRQHCTSSWRSISLFIHRKFLALTKRAPPHHDHHRFHRSYSAIYVDELFPGPVPLAEPRKTKENMDESSSGKSANKSRPGSTTATHNDGKIQIQAQQKGLAAGKGKAKAGESSKSSGPADKWTIPMLPQFRGIDERAEEFIAKFRQDMKIQREQSILDYEEMLKRSA
ncbi:hypothetical protein Pfo_026437 [Paulownia fortunei]|nr:hypothetical protein Pfo_026437 [Paulownia fortunei]